MKRPPDRYRPQILRSKRLVDPCRVTTRTSQYLVMSQIQNLMNLLAWIWCRKPTQLKLQISNMFWYYSIGFWRHGNDTLHKGVYFPNIRWRQLATVERPLSWKYGATTSQMMTSSNGNIFHITSPLCGKFTSHRWILVTKRPVTQSFDAFFALRLKKTVE